MKQNDIFKTYGTEYKSMTKLLLEESNLAERIPANAKIGIKPNLVSPTPAEYGATTHPEVVAGIIEYLKEHGFSNMVILEGSWIGDKTEDAYEYCGYRSLTENYGVPFVDAQKEKFTLVDCDGLDIKICNEALTIDFMINVPVLKGHGQTKITCALKNMKGLIPNSEKRHFHTMGLHQPIAHLSKGIKQDFIVVDHICGDLELEDGGNPIETNCIMTALDPVLLDSYVCHMLGYEVSDVPYVELSGQLGSGSTDLSKCVINVFDFKNEINCKASITQKKEFISNNIDMNKQRATRITFAALEEDPFEERRCPSENLMDISYAIEDADSCSACYASLAPAILRLKDEGLYEGLLEKLQKMNDEYDGEETSTYGKIAIGQGFSGKTGCFGVGNCCRNFKYNIPGCPPEEEEVYEKLRTFL